MKQLIVSILLLFAASTIKSQNTNLIFFSEQGEHFSVVMNGILQNDQPTTNIKVTDLPAPNYKLKIIFEDKKIPDIDKNLMFGQGTETTFVIRKNKKNQYVVRYLNEVPIAQAPVPVQTQTVILYHPEPVKQVSTTTTTTTTSAPAGVGAGVNINDPVSGANMNINLNMGAIGSATTTTTTTTTTSSTGNRDDINNHERPAGYHSEDEHHGNRGEHGERGERGERGRHDGSRYELEGYNGEYGCPYPMSREDFAQAKQSIESKSFDDSKLAIAKQIINTNCLLSSQVKELMLLFSFEDTRLELAKYCYGYTLDIGNYYQVNDAFKFESSIDDLNKYISGFRR
ncbi:MAG: DUF4476 domain-containing protein [Bacteroidetes bacterium]|nr:DUF4476 domain-containing protein [Bacteroidota bacterium]